MRLSRPGGRSRFGPRSLRRTGGSSRGPAEFIGADQNSTRTAIRADQAVQRVDSGQRGDIAAVADGNARPPLRKLARDALNGRGGHVDLRGDLFGRVVGKRRGPFREAVRALADEVGVVELLVDDDVRHRKREQTFGSGLDWQPLVGARSGLRQPRLRVHELAAYTGPSLTELAVRIDVVHRRQERLEQIRVERQQVVGVREVRNRQPRDAGHELHRLPERRRIERIVGDDVRCTEPGRESLDHRAHRPAIAAAGQQRNPQRRCLLRLQLGDEQLLRLFPRDRLILSRTAGPRQFQRSLDAIGMVEHLHAGLTAGAGAAHADRVIGIALDFFGLHRLAALLLTVDDADRLTLHDAHGDATARGTLLAHRPNPSLFSRHEAVFGDEQRNQLLRRAASVEDDPCSAGDTAGFEEVSAFHLWHTRQSMLTCFSLWQSMHLPIVHLTFSRMSMALAMSPWQVEHSTPALT